MKITNIFLVGLSLMSGIVTNAAEQVKQEEIAEIDMMDPSYVLTNENITSGFSSFSDNTFQREFRFTFDLSLASPEELKKFYKLSEEVQEIRKRIDFDDNFDLEIFERSIDYYDQTKELFSKVHQVLSNLYYSPYNISRINPNGLITAKKKLILSFKLTIGQPVFLKSEHKKMLTVQNLQDFGLDDIQSYIKAYKSCLDKQAEGISDFVRINKESIFVEDMDEPVVNGGIKALGFMGRFRRFFEKEQTHWRDFFVLMNSNASEALFTKIAFIQGENDFEAFVGANVDIDCQVELTGVNETDFVDEEGYESEDESEDEYYDVKEDSESQKIVFSANDNQVVL